jgi:[histone H3]-lysine4 N-trimethyltransferase SETD1
MPPPTGASFAKFFPAAPRVAKARAIEREKAKLKAHEAPAPIESNQSKADQAHTQGGARPVQETPFSDASQPQTDGNDSPPGDSSNPVGSVSSHTSTGSSSVLSSSVRQSATTGSSRISTTSVTPLTSMESPTYMSNSTPGKPNVSTSQASDWSERIAPPNTTDTHMLDAPSSTLPYIERVPARDPTRSVQGIKCIYDPFLDRALPKSEKKDAKPRYKEFGWVRKDYIPPLSLSLVEGGLSSFV